MYEWSYLGTCTLILERGDYLCSFLFWGVLAEFCMSMGLLGFMGGIDYKVYKYNYSYYTYVAKRVMVITYMKVGFCFPFLFLYRPPPPFLNIC